MDVERLDLVDFNPALFSPGTIAANDNIICTLDSLPNQLTIIFEKQTTQIINDVDALNMDCDKDTVVLSNFDGNTGKVVFFKKSGPTSFIQDKTFEIDNTSISKCKVSGNFAVCLGFDTILFGGNTLMLTFEKKNNVWDSTNTVVNSNRFSLQYSLFERTMVVPTIDGNSFELYQNLGDGWELKAERPVNVPDTSFTPPSFITNDELITYINVGPKLTFFDIFDGGLTERSEGLTYTQMQENTFFHKLCMGIGFAAGVVIEPSRSTFVVLTEKAGQEVIEELNTNVSEVACGLNTLYAFEADESTRNTDVRLYTLSAEETLPPTKFPTLFIPPPPTTRPSRLKQSNEETGIDTPEIAGWVAFGVTILIGLFIGYRKTR